MKTLWAIILFLSISFSSHAQFTLCDSPTEKTLHDVVFVNQDLGIAVGDSGIIVRSTDGGLNWSIALEIDSLYFKKVKFFDASVGIALGSHLYRTEDGGKIWEPIQIQNDYFFDLEILNSNTCIISGYPQGILRSEDLGASWTTLVESSDSLNFGFLSFPTELIGYSTTGFAGGGITSHIQKTEDGGFTWQTIEAESGDDPVVMEAFNFISADIGFRGGWYNPHLMRTTDGGVNWSPLSYSDTSIQTPFWEQLLDFHIEKNQPYTYYACGWYGRIFKSIDGGLHWSQLASPVDNVTSLHGIYFHDDFLGWAVGAKGTILKTSNGGINSSTQPTWLYGINAFPNPTEGLIQLEYPEHYDYSRAKLHDVLGRLVFESKDETMLDLHHLQEGVYFLTLSFLQGQYTTTLILR